jgi:hypothetical protein
MANGRALGWEKGSAWTMARGLARQNRPPSALPAMPGPYYEAGWYKNRTPTLLVNLVNIACADSTLVLVTGLISPNLRTLLEYCAA